MIQAAALALTQAFSPPFRAVLLKSVGLALLLLALAGALLATLAARLIEVPNAHADTFAAVLTGIGVFVALAFLIGPVVSLIAGFFLDEIAELVEHTHYPQDPPGRELPIGRALLLSARFAGLVLLVNIGALLLLLVPGVNLIVWWLANGFLLGREYFELAALRFRPPDEVRALRRTHSVETFIGGLMIAALLAIPILNLATPIVATAFMVHLHKRIGRRMQAA